jgi:hypothetical protein
VAAADHLEHLQVAELVEQVEVAQHKPTEQRQ